MKKYVFCFLIFVSSIFSLYAAQPNTETFERALVDQKRSVEQTFLTYPEWFLVHSPAEYANFVRIYPAHDFPFIGHVQQLWSSYFSVINEQFQQHYLANIPYHIMICVIASSTTIEYLLRFAYENTIGRISWLFANQLTAEDHLGARVAQEYVDFIRKQPWYLFDFIRPFKELWQLPFDYRDSWIRQLERRYALSTEYLVKAAYAKLIEQATRAAYDPALLTTQVIVDHLPSSLPKNIKFIRNLPQGEILLELPRYEDFKIAAIELAKRDIQFKNIAGNQSIILVSIWLTQDTSDFPGDHLRIVH